jgi:hypothetical protein
MARIVVVHGVGQQTEGELTLHDRLCPALLQGITWAGGSVGASDVVFASYGECFRPPAEVLSPVRYFRAEDVANGYETELLLAWWRRAAAVDAHVVPPEEEVLARTPVWASRALAALSRSRFLADVSDRVLIGDLKQVHRYFTDGGLRAAVRGIVAGAIAADTSVVVAHSLGSVVAYEVLCASPRPEVRALVTLGSPLGLPNLVFDRLEPAPRPVAADGVRGHWPGQVREWTNVVDQGDVVAAVEDLRPLFGDGIRQIRVHNGSHAHDMRPYLTEKLTGAAIVAGLYA